MARSPRSRPKVSTAAFDTVQSALRESLARSADLREPHVMSYAKSVLQPGERIVATGRLHWTIYWLAIFFFVAGAILVWLEHRYWPDREGLFAFSRAAPIQVTAAAFGILVVVSFLYAWFIRWITEFAVTDKRVIYKRGFIWRRTEEMNMDKVETVDVDQSILGRILGYGTIHVRGTGAGSGIVVRRIGSPIALRSAITAK
jgi:membrane protein YdbS with pleckstrin-like domain